MKEIIQNQLSQIKELGLYREINSAEGLTSRTLEIKGQTFLNFHSNNYLNLHHHPDIIAQSQKRLLEFGTGSCGSRLLGGAYEYQEKLELDLAQFKQKQKALLFNSGYNANLALGSALGLPDTEFFFDRLNHASLYDGVRLSGSRFQRYRHNDLTHLEDLLKSSNKNKVLITESLFSMDGDFAHLSELSFLAKKYQALFVVDEAHAEGIYGDEGRGLLYLESVAPATDLIMGAFGKAYGAFGAYVAGDNDLIEWLIQKSRSFTYTTALPPAAIGAMEGSLKVCRKADEERKQLIHLGTYLRKKLSMKGWNILNTQSHIIPIIFGDNEKCLEVCNEFQKQGLWVQAIREPTVPKGTARLRINVNSAHTYSDLDLFISILEGFQ